MTKTTKVMAGLLAGMFLAVGCDDGGSSTNDGGADAIPIKSDVASVNGFVWDPEAFWLTVAGCGKDCPFPPITVPGVPTIVSSLVNGSQVSLIDPLVSMPTFFAPAVTNTAGEWHMNDVTSRQDPPYFMLSLPPAMGTMALNPMRPPFLPPIPAANYLPTISLKPVYTRWTLCLSQSSLLASDSGILAALAAHLTATGTPTTVLDFINPMKYGGVAITWMYQPQSAVVRVPAFGTQMTASAGTIYAIDWAPPGVLPPFLNQSPRGFYVGPGPTSSIGVSVVLLPVAMAPTPVQFTSSDPVTDKATGRPWQFPPLPPIPVAPGVVSFNELPGLQPGSPPPPNWVCLGNL